MQSEKPSLAEWLAVGALRQRESRERLAKLPIREIVGVVDASAVSGSLPRGQTLWTLRFDFSAWKFPAQNSCDKPLRLSKQVSEDELRATQSAIKPYEILRVRVHIADSQSSNDEDGALLVEIVGPDNSDPELTRASQKLQEPVTFEDNQFGLFCLDRAITTFEAATTWASMSMTLSLRVEKDLDAGAALETARALWSAQADWDQRIVERAVHNLLEIKNDCWLDEGEDEISREQFVARMRLETVSVAAGGRFDFWFADGDLFWGHSIRVSGNLAEGPARAEIFG